MADGRAKQAPGALGGGNDVSDSKTTDRYRNHAESLRRAAKDAMDAGTRLMLLTIADDFERMPEEVERKT